MTLRKSLVLLVALVLVGCVDHPAPVVERDAAVEMPASESPANDVESATPDAGVIAAWEAAGFEFGWMDVFDYTFLTPQERSKNNLIVCEIPAFSFTEGGALEESLRELPQPRIPFGLVCESANDAVLEELTGMTQLRSLDLCATETTDAGLEDLKGLTNLDVLSLWDTKVTDAGLVHLKGLTGLRLNLWKTQVTGEGVRKLQEALPDCYVGR